MSSCATNGDIEELRGLISANTSAIEQIQTLIANGSVIKDVTAYTEGNGGIRITLSNGKTYDVTNGAQGIQGEKGDKGDTGATGADGKNAVVWTIGDDGYWYMDGTKTDYLALGKNGTNGVDGKDGNYYVPNATSGCFDLYSSNGTFIESTTIKWQGTGVTATIDANNLLTLSNVSYGTTTTTVTIPVAQLSSVSIDMSKIEATESGYPAVDFDSSTGTATVTYLLNPSKAYTGSITGYSVKSNAVTAKSATTGTFSIEGTPTISDGVLTVTIKTTGFTTDKKDMFAIVLTTDKGDIVSDYAVADKAAPNSLLPGKFSVSATKQVQFTKGNLYYSTTDNAYHLEATQNATYVTLGQSAYTASHVCHFFWANTTDWQTSGKEPWASTYSYSAQATTDKFFCGEENKMTVDGTEGLYALTQDEWTYLISSRTNHSKLYKYGVSVTTSAGTVTNCLVIAPDNYSGTIAASYDATAWATAEAAGLVCLPAAGYRQGSDLESGGSNGSYWSAMPTNKYIAYYLDFGDKSVTPAYGDSRGDGCSVRLVK